MIKSLITLILISSVFLTACQSKPGETTTSPSPTPVATPKPTETIPTSSTYPSQGWNTDYEKLVKLMVTEKMLTIPDSRMTKFCDVWPKLNREERKQMWADLMYAIVGPESGYDDVVAMVEDTMGLDAVTGLPVASEGKFQLSYQDEKWYGKGCDFDWPVDRDKMVRDLTVRVVTAEQFKTENKAASGKLVGVTRADGKVAVMRSKGSFKAQARDRSTLDPIRNIKCAMTIADYHVTRTSREFADAMGEYWFVMQRKNSKEYAQVWAGLNKRNTKCK